MSSPSGKILIVEDTQTAINDFKKILAQTGIEIHAAGNAEDGLKILEKEEIDLVFSDFRMGPADGLQFLKGVRKAHPSVHRVLTSGFLDKSMVFKFINSGLVTTFIAKPWDDESLRKKLTHILKIKSILQKKKLLDLISSIETLPTLPYLYQELLLAIESNKSMTELAEIIKKDTAVSAKVMHVVNSAFFGRDDISTIKEAAIFLGYTALKDIVLTAEIIDKMKWNKEQIDHLREIFFHSFLVNKYIPIIHRIRFSKSIEKQLPSAGIIHDIGKMIILKFFPERYESILARQIQNPDASTFDNELALGFEECTHTEIGAYFLDWWNFPEVMIEVALFHHRKERALVEYKDVLWATDYADRLVNRVCLKRDSSQVDLSSFYLENISKDVIDKIARNITAEYREHKTFIEGLV